jgi:hypothetical protein
MTTALVALVLAMKLLVVQEVQAGDPATTVVFASGEKATLLKTDKGYEASLKLLERSRERKAPVGIAIEVPDKPADGPVKPGHLVEVARADSDFVKEIAASDKNKDGLRVRLQAHDGMLELAAGHPDFKRIKATLDDAVAKKTRIWYVVKPDFTIRDLIVLEAKKDDGSKTPPADPGKKEGDPDKGPPSDPQKK